MLVWDGYGLQSIYSGIGRHAWELAGHLALRGHAPHILPSALAMDEAFQVWRAPHAKGLPGGAIKPLALWVAGRQARRLVKGQEGPHLFHGLSNYNLPDLPPTFRRVLTVHDLIPFLSPDGVSSALRYYLHWQMPSAISRADRIICVSQWTAECLKALYPGAKEKIQVILNGRPEATERERVKPFEGNTKIRIFSLSRGETYKRLQLIPAISKALPEAYEWHVLTDSQGLHTLAKAASPRLQLHTALSDAAVHKIWRASQVFVHPSLWEGYCLPAASALNYGIPTVFTGGSGIDEVVGEGGIKMLSADDPELWANAIQQFGRNPQMWQQRCFKQWGKLPSWGEVGAQIQELYDTLIR